jgi:hypothetical protein
MARDLRTRLAGIRSTTIPRNPTTSSQRILAGWEQISPHFWMRERSLPVPPVDFDQPLDAATFSARLRDSRLVLTGLRFFDLETTGLSGGTGTVAFLATVGRFTTCNGFTTVQYFMDDYPGEPALVNRLARDLSETATIVTYNGASFDLPLFRTRCIMNGLKPPELPRHVDLLPVARRLWRTVLPDCSLGTIEKSILSIDRGPDLPGSAIPERWFSYLRGGNDTEEAMEVVFSHNDSDVRTLGLLLIMMAKGFAKGSIFRADPVGLAFLLGRSNPELALATLELALEKGESRAIKPLMRNYWKAGRREDRMRLVPLLPDDSYGLYMKSLRAEKVDRDLAVALSLAGQALAVAESSMAKRLEQRLKRLVRLQRVSCKGQRFNQPEG